MQAHCNQAAKTKGTDKIFKAVRTTLKLKADFSKETTQARRQCYEVKINKQNYQHKTLFPKKVFFNKMGEIKRFSDQQRLN